MIQRKKAAFFKWQKLITEFYDSGLKPGEFCRRNELNTKTFYAWRKRIKGSRFTASNEAFVEVNVKEDSGAQAASSDKSCSIQIFFNDKYKIVVEEDFVESTLQKVINVLGESAC